MLGAGPGRGGGSGAGPPAPGTAQPSPPCPRAGPGAAGAGHPQRRGRRVKAGLLYKPAPYTLASPSASSAAEEPPFSVPQPHEGARFGGSSPMRLPSSLQAVTPGSTGSERCLSRAGAAGGSRHWLPSPGARTTPKCHGRGIRV